VNALPTAVRISAFSVISFVITFGLLSQPPIGR
jgi:hypothetical protein